MEYPKDPTVLPSAQRHTEIYNADQGRTFTDGEVITIQIPPTNHSYLTKDAMLHFDFDMSYYEGTDANYKEIVGNIGGDNKSLTFGASTNTLVFTNPASTGTFPSGSYALQDIPAVWKASNPTSPFALYWEDSINTMHFVKGLLVQDSGAGQNNISQCIAMGSLQDPVVMPAGQYFLKSDVGYILSMVDAYNARQGTLTLSYSTATKKFFFVQKSASASEVFIFTVESSPFLQLLGFNAFTTPKSSVDVSGTQTLTADNQVDISTPLSTVAAGSTAATVFGITTLPTTFAAVAAAGANTAYQQLIVVISSTTNITKTAKDFIDQLIYKPLTSWADVASTTTNPNLYRPYPTLDTNGPYGFISSLEVYDYLGNTLIEKIPDHDLLTAIWTDLDNSTETKQTILRTNILNSVDDLSITKPSCSYLVKGDRNTPFLQSPAATTTANTWTEETTSAALITLPQISFGIQLYSFLGKLSEKFVPLHNGFTIKFYLNRREDVIAFNTQQPGNVISYTIKTTSPVTSTSFTTTMKPSIKTYAFSNAYIRADIVTVPPDLDSRIDKVVFAKAYKVQAGVPLNRAQRINTEVKSLTSVLVVQQPDPGPGNNYSLRQSAFIRNYCPAARLLFNKAAVSAVRGFDQAYRNFTNVFGCTWDKYLTRESWDVDTITTLSSWMQTRVSDKYNLPTNDPFWTDFTLTLGFIPRYILAFDTRLPGYTPMAVCGIDTRKELLEVQLDTTTSTSASAKVTLISEFDTFIEVKPSESTAVSF